MSIISPSNLYFFLSIITNLNSFVSRASPKSNDRHVVLGVMGYDPRKFAEQMGLNLANGWGIVRTIVDMCRSMEEGKYVLVKDPNKTLLRLYKVPMSTFEDIEEDGEVDGGEGEDGE